jgi:hypothetical protein
MRRKVPTRQLSEHVETILKAAVQAADQEYSAAKREFWRVCGQQNGGEPQKLREAEAANVQSLAREKVIDALGHLNRFMLDGTVPEQLKYLNAQGDCAVAALA